MISAIAHGNFRQLPSLSSSPLFQKPLLFHSTESHSYIGLSTSGGRLLPCQKNFQDYHEFQNKVRFNTLTPSTPSTQTCIALLCRDTQNGYPGVPLCTLLLSFGIGVAFSCSSTHPKGLRFRPPLLSPSNALLLNQRLRTREKCLDSTKRKLL